jgi:hypothetical protein
MAGMPRTKGDGSQEDGDTHEWGSAAEAAFYVQLHARRDDEERDEHPEADRFQLGAEHRVGAHLVAVHELQRRDRQVEGDDSPRAELGGEDRKDDHQQLATGEKVRKRRNDTRDGLTQQEERMRTARPGRTSELSRSRLIA